MKTTELKSKLQKSVDFLQSELSSLKAGRANPSLIENVKVEAYGTTMRIIEVGAVTILDLNNLVINVWDKMLIPSVLKGISESGLNLSPVNDGGNIRVPIPPLTEDRRKEIVKIVSEKVEEAKISLRMIRQDVMKNIDRDFAEKEITEDEKFTFKDEVEKVVKEFVTTVDTMGEDKKKDIMTV